MSARSTAQGRSPFARLALAFALATVVAAIGVAWRPVGDGPETGDELTYDRFMRDYPLARRYAMFTEELSPAKKVALMMIHYDRCLAALGPTLSDEQRAIIADAKAALSTGAYETPPDPQANARMEAVERRAQAAFPEQLGVQVFTMWSECQRTR